MLLGLPRGCCVPLSAIVILNVIVIVIEIVFPPCGIESFGKIRQMHKTLFSVIQTHKNVSLSIYNSSIKVRQNQCYLRSSSCHLFHPRIVANKKEITPKPAHWPFYFCSTTDSLDYGVCDAKIVKWIFYVFHWSASQFYRISFWHKHKFNLGDHLALIWT